MRFNMSFRIEHAIRQAIAINVPNSLEAPGYAARSKYVYALANS